MELYTATKDYVSRRNSASIYQGRFAFSDRRCRFFLLLKYLARSFPVAERPRDALCMSVVIASTVQYLKYYSYFGFRFTTAYN